MAQPPGRHSRVILRLPRRTGIGSIAGQEVRRAKPFRISTRRHSACLPEPEKRTQGPQKPRSFPRPLRKGNHPSLSSTLPPPLSRAADCWSIIPCTSQGPFGRCPAASPLRLASCRSHVGPWLSVRSPNRARPCAVFVQLRSRRFPPRFRGLRA